MIYQALVALGFTALLVQAQQSGLSQFTVANWNDIHYGQATILSWTPGNGRPVSAQLDNDNGPYVFDFISPQNNNTYFTWTPDYSLSPGPHTLVLTQGPIADTSPPFMIQGMTSNATSTTNSSTASVLTPTGPAGVGSSTASVNSSSLTSTSPGGPVVSAPTPTSTVQTTVQPTDTGGSVVNTTVFSTSYETNAAGSTTGINSSPIATQVEATETSAIGTPSGTAGATASAALQSAIAARSSLPATGGLTGSGMGVFMTLLGGLAFAWLLL